MSQQRDLALQSTDTDLSLPMHHRNSPSTVHWPDLLCLIWFRQMFGRLFFFVSSANCIPFTSNCVGNKWPFQVIRDLNKLLPLAKNGKKQFGLCLVHIRFTKLALFPSGFAGLRFYRFLSGILAAGKIINKEQIIRNLAPPCTPRHPFTMKSHTQLNCTVSCDLIRSWGNLIAEG